MPNPEEDGYSLEGFNVPGVKSFSLTNYFPSTTAKIYNRSKF
jgi:hypothetical protein